MAKKSRKGIKRHSRIRVCYHCGRVHKRAQHRSHGRGSHLKTHPGYYARRGMAFTTTKRKKRRTKKRRRR